MTLLQIAGQVINPRYITHYDYDHATRTGVLTLAAGAEPARLTFTGLDADALHIVLTNQAVDVLTAACNLADGSRRPHRGSALALTDLEHAKLEHVAWLRQQREDAAFDDRTGAA